MLFRYFGDKLGLYAQVLRHADKEANALLAPVFAPLLENQAAPLNAQQLRTLLEAMVRTLFDYLLAHPRFVRILMWEMAEGWQTYAQISSRFPSEDVDLFQSLFQRTEETALFRSDFVPTIQLTMALQMCITYLSSLPLYQTLLPAEDLSSGESLTRAREYIVGFIVAGILIDPIESERRGGRCSKRGRTDLDDLFVDYGGP